MNAILTALSGKKTYIVVAVFVLCVVVERFLGVDIPGFSVGDNWLELVLGMLGFGTMRAAINKLR